MRRVRRQRDGGFPRAFLQGSVPHVGLLRFVHFYLYRGPVAVASLVCLGAHKVSTRPPTALQLHCTSSSHWGWSRFSCGGLFQVVGQVGGSVALSVEVTPKRSKERCGSSQRLQGQSPKTSQRLERQSLKKVQSTWPAESGWTSEGFWQFVQKVQSTWSVRWDRTSEGFCRPVDLACRVWQDK